MTPGPFLVRLTDGNLWDVTAEPTALQPRPGPGDVSAPDAAGLVPVAPSRSLFARYRRREGILVNLVAGGLFGSALGLAAVSAVTVGPMWGLGALTLGVGAMAWLANAWGLLGNATLARRLASLLGLEVGEWTFVGVCRGDQNRLRAKLFPPRVETDENVGFMRLEDGALVLRLEDKTIEVSRSRVRDVRTEEVVEAPYLHWIRIELYDADERLDTFLLMSREGRTLRDQRAANDRLFEKMRDWHVSDKLQPLVEAGELPQAVNA